MPIERQMAILLKKHPRDGAPCDCKRDPVTGFPSQPAQRDVLFFGLLSWRHLITLLGEASY